MGSKKTSGNVICLITDFHKVKWSHCIHLAEKRGVKKNERICYHYANRKWKSQKVMRASPRRSKTVQNGPKKNERFWNFHQPYYTCSHVLKTAQKSADARFFRSIYSFFWLFENWKNRKNVRKITFFPIFSYAVRHLLQYIHVT